jgi:hypothetical protein
MKMQDILPNVSCLSTNYMVSYPKVSTAHNPRGDNLKSYIPFFPFLVQISGLTYLVFSF